MKKILNLLLIIALFFTLNACSNKTIKNESISNTNQTGDTYNKLPEIISLDKKMSNYFDISLFDEENYSNIYLNKNFKLKVTYNDKKISLPVEKAGNVFYVECEAENADNYDKNVYMFFVVDEENPYADRKAVIECVDEFYKNS